MPECKNCGGHVTAEFVRVMGDNDGNVWCCTSCEVNSIGDKAAKGKIVQE